MNRSRSRLFSFFLHILHLSRKAQLASIFPADAFTKYRRRGQKCGRISARLTAQTPIRAHLAGGTSILIRLKAPILCDVIYQNTGIHITRDRDAFNHPANLFYPYAASINLSHLSTNSSLNNSPVKSIARIILNNFLHTATIAIFLRVVCPAITRS